MPGTILGETEVNKTEENHKLGNNITYSNKYYVEKCQIRVTASVCVRDTGLLFSLTTATGNSTFYTKTLHAST